MITREDNVKRAASEYLRKAWDAAVDAHALIRSVRRKYQAGSTAAFTAHRAILMDLSKLMDLSIHEQAASKALVTTLDVALSESIARGVRLVRMALDAVPFPNPVGVLTDLQLRDQMVATAVTNYGNLLRDAARDKALLDWLVAHYHTLPSV